MVGIVLQNRFPPFWFFLLFVLLCVSIFLNGCGELTLPVGAGGFVAAENSAVGGATPGGVAPNVAEGAPKAVSEAEFAGFKRIIESDVYDGKLTVFLHKDVGAWEYPSIISEKYPGVKPVRKTDLMTASEKEDRQGWEEANGMKLFDWGRVYYFDVAERKKALALQRELMSRPEVWLVYPGQRGIGAHGGDGTPSLVDRQIYLGGTDQAGMEVTHAWANGIYGQGVDVDFRDGGFFEAHEDFQLLRGLECGIEDVGRNGLCTYSGIAHGTATAGLIHAKHQHGEMADEHGMRGIAPDSALYQGVGRGDILVKEEALPFGLDENSRRWVSCQHDDFGEGYGACVPIIAAPDSYIGAREMALLHDIITMIPVANGAINLDAVEFVSEELRGSVCAGAADEVQRADCERHSQFVLAGAHQGDRGMVEVGGQRRPVKWRYSNCGSEVELSSWGERVVTTAWRHPDGSAVRGYDWDGPNGPPNDAAERAYTNQFGGTSAGAALVAGAAALVQSYFKDLAEGVANDGLFAKTRYLRPAKLKEILIASGLPVEAADGCGVGVQPRISEAFRLVREYWGDVRQRFPELEGRERLTEERLRALRGEGFGLTCWISESFCPEYIPALRVCNRDGSGEWGGMYCFAEDISPHIAKKMDFDEDGRGDLVSWEPGVWRIDLSADPEGDSPDDNYGEWDVTLAYPVTSRWEVAVVEDYDSDGKADLAVYDRERGRWLIAVTTERTLQGVWDGWTYEVAWPLRGDSGYWEEEFYTRPLPADYNGDGWVDLAVQTSDGHWAIHFGWRTGRVWERVGRRYLEFGPLIPEYEENAVGRWLSPGVWDLSYLTPEELQEYPGWAYLPSAVGKILWRGPGGVVKGLSLRGDRYFNYAQANYPSLGGLENIPVIGAYDDELGVKTDHGIWQYYVGRNFESPNPDDIFGSAECKPLPGILLDDDTEFESIVMCPDEWRIVYSGDRFDHQNNGGGFRHVHLGYTDSKALPGTPAFGGLSYERITQVREFLRESGAREVEPFFDYAMHPFDYCALDWEEAERPEECL